MISLILTAEALDEIRHYVFHHCPCALEDAEFLPGLIAILEEEVVVAIQRERTRLHEQLRKQSQQ
jgi:hypothetical protein